MYQPVYPVVDDDLLQALEVENVREYEGPVNEALVGRLYDVRQYDVLVAIVLAQQLGALRAQLAEATLKVRVCSKLLYCKVGRTDTRFEIEEFFTIYSIVIYYIGVILRFVIN